MTAPLRIISRRVSWPSLEARGDRAGLRLRWNALDEAGAILAAATEFPLADGAHALIQRGAHPETLVTLRHEGAEHDSFAPVPLHIPARHGARRAARAESAGNRLRGAAHRAQARDSGSEGVTGPEAEEGACRAGFSGVRAA